MIELFTFGALDLRAEEDSAGPGSILPQNKRLAFLVYLRLLRPRGFHRRDHLLGVFWPELSERRARRALNQTVYVLRRALGEEAVVGRGPEELAVDPERVWADAAAFESALERGAREEALVLYRGPFLNGFHLGGSTAFERWLDVEQRRYRRLAVDAATGLAASRAADADPEGELRWLRWAARYEPYDEGLHRRLIAGLVERGAATKAAREYRAFTVRLRAELGASAGAETEELGERLREHLEALESEPAGPLEVRGEPPEDAEDADREARRRRRGARLAAAATAVALLAVAAGLMLYGRFAAPDGPPRVLVAPFDVEPDSALASSVGRIAADWIAAGIAETGLAEVVGPAAVVRWRRGTERPWPDDSAAASLQLRLISRRVGATLLLAGGAEWRGDSVVWRARLVDPEGGQILRAIQFRDAASGDPMPGVDRLRDGVLGALGTAVDRRFGDWAGATDPPPSYEAYRRFADGMDLYLAGRWADAAERFEGAAGDSVFAAAVLWAAWAHLRDFFARGAIHESVRARADSLLGLLRDRRAELSPWEAAMLDHHAATVRFDYAAAHEAVSRAVARAPDIEWRFRKVQLAMVLDRPREMLAELDAIDPDAEWLADRETRYWALRGRALHRLGRYGEELEIARRRLAANPADAAGRRLELRALAGLGRRLEVRRWVDTHGWTPGLHQELLAHGFEPLSDSLTAVKVEEMQVTPVADRDDEWHYERGVAVAGLDRLEEARTHLARIGPGSPRHLDALGELGWVLARLGRRKAALEISERLEAIDELGWRLTLQARIAAALGERDRAVRLLSRMPMQGYLHPEVEFESLRGYPPFERLLRPRG